MTRKKHICCNNLNDIIESIALQETGLSHILNAEGEKIQKAIELATCVDDLVKINYSLQDTLIDVTSLETVLFNKLRTAVSAECDDNPPIITGGICIYVYSCTCKEPIGEVSIKIFSEEGMLIDSSVTNDAGKYCIKNLPLGSYTVVITNPYTSLEETIFVVISETEKYVSKSICFTKPINKYVNIKGVVCGCGGVRIEGATITATGLSTKTTLSDASGNYEILNLNISDKFVVGAEYKGKSSITYTNTNPIYTSYIYNFKISI
ncbi:MAG: carboxypeptidase-like regulatory domain-containing protein [Clostridia bacterium]